MLGFISSRITPADLFRFARAKARGLKFYGLADLIRSKKRQRLEAEPLIRIAVNELSVELWPHQDFRDPRLLLTVDRVFGQFGFALHREGPRPLTEREYGQLRRTYSASFLAQALPNGTTWLEVPLKVQSRSDPLANDDLRTSLGAGAEWKSLKEIRDIVAQVRMRHLPPGSTGIEFFM